MCHKLGLQRLGGRKIRMIYGVTVDPSIIRKRKANYYNDDNYQIRVYFEYRMLKNKGSNYNKLKDKLFKYVLRAE